MFDLPLIHLQRYEGLDEEQRNLDRNIGDRPAEPCGNEPRLSSDEI